ncbi:hypothetical protein T4B_12318 [Trichinella pseudospiralis]|uniref:Uncharacterized protein n=2 Tax=Trichinella pseudospiralis TaxID=6337 RepID=A0A0V1JN36_TRIPS|nr:hypothetical protein T4D_7561 [Trichinella pseudospiralis]KRZ12420.1 hypothetical protein T4B_12318 [Trichinella pseudospiralis]KRZ35989.1 hypothetical protein T4C_8480 [Trichinella pseudospiralis]
MANMPGVEPVLKVDRRWRDQIESYRAARSSIPLDKIELCMLLVTQAEGLRIGDA